MPSHLVVLPYKLSSGSKHDGVLQFMAPPASGLMEPMLTTGVPRTHPLAARSRRRKQLAVSIHFPAWPDWRDAFRVLLERARHITRVGISAGRADWTFYQSTHDRDAWSDTQRAQSADMLEVAVNELGEREICTTAVLDVCAPRYLKKRPQYAAVDARGRCSTAIVCSTALAEGEYGRIVTDAFEALAASTSADSLAVTNLQLGWHCFCARCLARFHGYAWRKDWPRLPNGAVDLLNPAIGQWRSQQVAEIVSRLSFAAHAHGKQMMFEVKPSRDAFSRNSRENGQNYAVLQRHVDELVVRNHFAVEGAGPEQSTAAAHYLGHVLGPDDYWHCVGLCDRDGLVLEAHEMRLALMAALRGGAPRLWIAPSHCLSPMHWQQLDGLMNGDDLSAVSAH